MGERLDGAQGSRLQLKSVCGYVFIELDARAVLK